MFSSCGISVPKCSVLAIMQSLIFLSINLCNLYSSPSQCHPQPPLPIKAARLFSTYFLKGGLWRTQVTERKNINICLSFVFEITNSLEESESKDNIFEWGGIYFLKDSIHKGWERQGGKETGGGINDNVDECGSPIKSFSKLLPQEDNVTRAQCVRPKVKESLRIFPGKSLRRACSWVVYLGRLSLFH